MFIQMKSGAMLNLFWLQDCFQGKHDKNIAIFYMVNGVKLKEEFDTEVEAAERVNEVRNKMNSTSKYNNAENEAVANLTQLVQAQSSIISSLEQKVAELESKIGGNE